MLRLGIIGTGRIAERFVKEAWQNYGFILSAVYNPHGESANAFVVKHLCDLEKGYTGGCEEAFVISTDEFDEFLKEVDAVYVASPHDTHFSYAQKLLEEGKHVLCEKPLAFTQRQAEQLYLLAKEKGLVLMEALKTAYCPGFQGLLDTIESGKIGELVEVEACFTRITPTNTREWTDLAYGGSFTELGSYVLYPVIKLLGTNYKEVNFHSRYHVNGLDAFTKIDFDYGNRFASCKVGIGAKSEGQMIITGSKGYIVVQAPWWMTRKFQVRYEDPNRVEEFEFPYEGSGLQYECGAFADRILQKSVKKVGLSDEESIAMAAVLEKYLEKEMPARKAYETGRYANRESLESLKIWAHRGCSMEYPENTLEAFLAAARTPGVEGIELDVQLTKDGEVVVFHDENVSRVTDGNKNVAEYTLEQLKKLKVAPGTPGETQIPTLEEVLVAMEPYCKSKDFKINIELKTSIVHYQGIEEKTYALVKKYGLVHNIVYSSFWAESVKKMKELNPENQTGMLAGTLSDCIRWGRYAGVDALHPWIGGMDCEIPEDMKNYPVRAWNGEEPFYRDGRMLKERHLEKYRMFGVTEIITNVPGEYV